jgi:hypothetical protein
LHCLYRVSEKSGTNANFLSHFPMFVRIMLDILGWRVTQQTACNSLPRRRRFRILTPYTCAFTNPHNATSIRLESGDSGGHSSQPMSRYCCLMLKERQFLLVPYFSDILWPRNLQLLNRTLTGHHSTPYIST